MIKIWLTRDDEWTIIYSSFFTLREIKMSGNEKNTKTSILVTKDDFLDYRLDHDSFGYIKVNRSYGRSDGLFCTNVEHDSTIDIEIGKAYGYMSAINIRHLCKKPLVSLSMTAVQWSEFVSSFGAGSGVPCTLTRAEGEHIQTPSDKWDYAGRIVEKFEEDTRSIIDGRINTTIEKLKEYEKNGKKISKGELGVIIGDLRMVNNIPSNIDFYREQIKKDAEKVTVEAIKNAEGVISIFKEIIAERALGLDGGNGDEILKISE